MEEVKAAEVMEVEELGSPEPLNLEDALKPLFDFIGCEDIAGLSKKLAKASFSALSFELLLVSLNVKQIGEIVNELKFNHKLEFGNGKDCISLYLLL
jgi:hypothetical protein